MYAEKGIHLQEAVELLLRAIAIEPQNSAFLDSLGWAYYQLGELDQAEQYLAQSMEWMDEGDAEEAAVICEHAGDIAHAQGRSDDAQRYWRRALEFDPDNGALRAKLNN